MVTWYYFSFNVLSWVLYSLILTFLLLLPFGHLCSTPLHFNFSFPYCFILNSSLINMKIPLKKSSLNNNFSSSMLTFCCFSCSVLKWSPTLFNSMNCSMPGSSVLHYLQEFTQIHVHWSVMLSNCLILFSFCLQSFSSSGSFPMTSSLHQVAKVLDLQLQHQSFQWIFSVDYL